MNNPKPWNPHALAALVAIARQYGSIPHMSHWEAIVRATSMCVGNSPIRQTCTWSLVSMLRRRIADVSPPHVHGDCSYRGTYGRHLPLWSRSTNMRQPGSQTKFLRVKANVVPSHLRVLHETILPLYTKTRLLGKIRLCLGSRHPRRIQAHQGKGEKMTKIQMARGSPMTSDTGAKPRTHGGHPRQYIVQPMNSNPLATLCPKPKPNTKRHPKLPKRWRSTERVDIANVTHLN